MESTYGKSIQSSSLCAICSALDLVEYFKEEKDDKIDRSTGFIKASSTARRLGLLRDICLKASECSFCWIVVQSVCTTRIAYETTPEALLEKEITASAPRECFLYSYCSAKNDRLDDNDPCAKAVRIGIALQAEGDQIGDIQLLDDDAMRIRNSRAFHGRRVPSQLDIGLASYWLYLCETHHGARCNETEVGDGPKDLMVIDVKRACVMKLPKGAKYLALSYCWPVEISFCALKSNIDDLAQPEALRQRWEKLPAVIQDTINFTSEFGETYLWIDALCIVQNDQEQKLTQIAQMDQIYASALMTIVPALRTLDPGKACVGLPRYNPKIKWREQKFVVAQGLHLSVPYEAIFGMTDRKTRWSTRGWTYQECLLSRRILFLTESQAYFQCRHSMFCEDCRGEIDATDVYIAPGTNLWNPGAMETSGGRLELGYGTLHLSRTPYSSKRRAILAYLNYVHDYSFRQLTNASDALNAFRGIQNVLQDSMQTRFWFGLPERFFDIALLFIPLGNEPRTRQPLDDYPRPRSFPSWSWPAWNYAVNNSGFFPCIELGILREVDWFLISNDGEAIALESMGVLNGPSFPQNGNRDLQMIGTIPGELLPKPKHQSAGYSTDITDNFVLGCWTMGLDLYLSARVMPLGSQQYHWPASKHLAICDDQGQWIGSILMDKIWVESCLDPSRPYRFILISRSENILVGRDPEVEVFDTDLFVNRPWCFLNVMMVEVLGINISRRLGVGTIHEDAWVLNNPIKMFVKLE